MQRRAHAQEKIVSCVEAALIGLAEPVPSDQMRRRERAFFKISHPQKILVIAQSAAAAFHIRLLHVHAVAELRVSRGLVLHAQFQIFAFESDNAFAAKLCAKRLDELSIAGEETRLRALPSSSTYRDWPGRLLP